jgi:hypothetical protein
MIIIALKILREVYEENVEDQRVLEIAISEFEEVYGFWD